MLYNFMGGSPYDQNYVTLLEATPPPGYVRRIFLHTDLCCSDCFEEWLCLFPLFEVGEERHVLERVAILVHEAGNLTGKTDVGRGHCGAVDGTICNLELMTAFSVVASSSEITKDESMKHVKMLIALLSNV